MKNITLCGINARYSHSNPALLYLKHAAHTKNDIRVLEFSINDRLSQIVGGIVSGSPDAVGFSCYIWNVEQVLKAASTVKKILPACLILLGGPEVSYESADMLKKYAFIDMIIRGQGETPFAWFAEKFEAGMPFCDTPSACIRDGGRIFFTADAPPTCLSSLPFIYPDLSAYENRAVYYETSRGCPFRCAYCMSANEEVTFLPTDRVKTELEYFIKANVRLVKLVDRTFNYPPGRAREIVQAMIALSKKYPQSTTCFHLEISAWLLEEGIIALLKDARKGLFHLEVGIQSTHPDTLKAVNRSHDLSRLLRSTATLCRMDNLRVHVDLIAGLPYESYDIFKKSFNDAYRLQPDTLQLGFLKVLKGSPLWAAAGRYAIRYTDYAPYEVLSTHVLSYKELCRLHQIERVLDILYNTGHCARTLARLVPAYASPFDFFERFAQYLDQNGYFSRPQKLQRVFEYLWAFSQEMPESEGIKEALVFDWLCLGKPSAWPQPLCPPAMEKAALKSFFGSRDHLQKYLPQYLHLPAKEIAKRCIIGVFEQLLPGQTAALFDYGKTAGDEGFCQIIPWKS